MLLFFNWCVFKINRIEVIRKSKNSTNESRSPPKQPETGFASLANKASNSNQIGSYSFPSGIRITANESASTTKKLGSKEIEVLKYGLYVY